MTEKNTTTQTFRILAADKLAAEGLSFIEDQPDCELDNKPGLSEDELAAIAGEYDGMIIRSGVTVTPNVLENAGRLKVIARAGVGVDNIDLDAATAKGILVMNSAEASTISTAEHAFTLLMSLMRNVGPAYKTMTEGGWDRSKFTGQTLHGKTLGVIGFGRIGQTVAQRALAFGMQIVAYDPFINSATALDGKARMYSDFKEMLPHADVLSFHVPLNDQTRSMLNDETFSLCREGVMIVNAARGGVVDEEALVRAADSGQCGGAAMDVFTSEPPAEDHPLRTHPKILVTPHLGASTKEGQQAVSVVAAQQAIEYLRGDGIRGAVNAAGFRVDLEPAQQSYVDLAKRMAELLSPMITRGICEITFDIRGKELAAAAGTIERSALIGLLSSHLDVPLNIINAKQVAEQRGIRLQTIQCDEKDEATQLTITVKGPDGSTDGNTKPGDETRRIVGRVYADLKPRIVEINGYHMDMIPTGHMVLIQNSDQPGVIGIVGSEFGEAKINIADMTISRRGGSALMLLKTDEAATPALIENLKIDEGIIKVAAVKLAD